MNRRAVLLSPLALLGVKPEPKSVLKYDIRSCGVRASHDVHEFRCMIAAGGGYQLTSDDGVTWTEVKLTARQPTEYTFTATKMSFGDTVIHST